MPGPRPPPLDLVWILAPVAFLACLPTFPSLPFPAPLPPCPTLILPLPLPYHLPLPSPLPSLCLLPTHYCPRYLVPPPPFCYLLLPTPFYALQRPSAVLPFPLGRFLLYSTYLCILHCVPSFSHPHTVWFPTRPLQPSWYTCLPALPASSYCPLHLRWRNADAAPSYHAFTCSCHVLAGPSCVSVCTFCLWPFPSLFSLPTFYIPSSPGSSACPFQSGPTTASRWDYLMGGGPFYFYSNSYIPFVPVPIPFCLLLLLPLFTYSATLQHIPYHLPTWFPFCLPVALPSFYPSHPSVSVPFVPCRGLLLPFAPSQVIQGFSTNPFTHTTHTPCYLLPAHTHCFLHTRPFPCLYLLCLPLHVPFLPHTCACLPLPPPPTTSSILHAPFLFCLWEEGWFGT